MVLYIGWYSTLELRKWYYYDTTIIYLKVYPINHYQPLLITIIRHIIQLFHLLKAANKNRREAPDSGQVLLRHRGRLDIPV